MCQLEASKVPNIFDSFFIKTSSMNHVKTPFATGLPFIYQKFTLITFNIRYTNNGPRLWNELDERFKLLSPNALKKN